MTTAKKSGWKTVKIRDLCKIKHGFAFKGKYFADKGEYILLTPGNFSQRDGLRLKGEKEKYYTGEIPSGYLLSQGDLLVVMTDLKQDAPYLGAPGIVKQDNLLHNQRLGLVQEINTDLVDENYLYWIFQSEEYRAQVRGSASGATVRHTAPERIYACSVSIPADTTTQGKLASILSAFDDLIENNTRRIRILEEMARLIYREWFVYYRFPGHENVKMVDSGTELGEVPEGWGVKPIGEVIETMGGGTPSTKTLEYWDNGNINWYSPIDLTKSGLMFMNKSEKKITDAGLRGSSAKMFPAYSVMMSSRATIGAIAINTTPACTNQGFITCIPNEQLSVYQIYFWLNHTMPTILVLASGATFKEITKTNFRNLPIAIAPEEIRIKYVEDSQPIFNLIENIERTNCKLRCTRDLLLPKLVSGQISIP